ncbi:HAD family phosphatase [Nocardia yamanashiensis]|uniref:HAD family hydrolase n=1 Tax=Nocardia yamanashiensis TaxID=209247 RepID=UPI001E5273E2|nr:HAD family phosphatase [Nocardia yamanashiensis]UGT44279.1 HAD family phosphatase [Nocardia yamanashiensis]
MGVRAVIFDIGGVLEVNSEMTFIADWLDRLGLTFEDLGPELFEIWAKGERGTVTESQVREAIRSGLSVDDRIADAVMTDMWKQYLGVANFELIDYLAGLRPRFRTGLLSNSFVGAREHESAAYGFEDLVDDIVYSHEVGMAKPDPRIYLLACRRLGVDPGETVFVDDSEMAVTGAESVGITAILHESNTRTIALLDAALL